MPLSLSRQDSHSTSDSLPADSGKKVGATATTTTTRKAGPSSISSILTSIEDALLNGPGALTASLAREETQAVICLRRAVLLVLVFVTVLVSSTIYIYTRDQEREDFTSNFEQSAVQVLESFHDVVQGNLNAVATLSATLTSYAHYHHQHQQPPPPQSSSNSSSTSSLFPFVTLPDFELHGSNLRATSGSHLIYWCPLITDTTRAAWEDFAMEHRDQATRSFERDDAYRTQQDLNYNHTTTTNTNNSTQTRQRRILQEADALTMLDDGTNYHPKLWSNGAVTPRGDEPPGGGKYLALWQQSPIDAGAQSMLNLNVANIQLLTRGIIDIMTSQKKALLNYVAEPIPAYKPYMTNILSLSQYRHNIDNLIDELHSMLTYPVFDTLNPGRPDDDDNDNRQVVGILVSDIYWKSLFSNLLPSNVEGITCVIENSFNQTFAYRIDGRTATFIGMGDPHDSKYNDMEVSTNINEYLEQRASPQTLAYKTVGLSDEIQYSIRVFPSQDTEDAFLTNKPVIYTVITIIVFVFAGGLFLAYSYVVERRQGTMTQKVIDNIQRAAETERELNEFLSHEVRNPLSAAISACTFVSTAVNEAEPMADEETRQFVRDDIEVVSASLHFINDFLRSMLDIYQANDNHITVALAPTDVLRDILEPISCILYKRLSTYELILDCPENLMVMTDSMRLKQVILNLARNSSKFVEHGFLRLRALVVDEQVRILVEDSGPGIPPEKRRDMFAKYQESLDLLCQGTGIGLNLSKKLMRILKGDLWLDESYTSGIEGCPGACFVVDLQKPALDIESSFFVGDGADASFMGENPALKELNGLPETATSLTTKNGPEKDSNIISTREESTSNALATSKSTIGAHGTTNNEESAVTTAGESLNELVGVSASEGMAESTRSRSNDSVNRVSFKVETAPTTYEILPACVEESAAAELPEDLSVLFVDDDAVLRKLFMRAVKKVAPSTWKVRDASSGEMALKLCETEAFQLIFMDQYMASIDKQLLGTETVEALRVMGVSAKICGLSANDLRGAFVNAGADDFILKPMPCKPAELKKMLLRILYPPNLSVRGSVRRSARRSAGGSLRGSATGLTATLLLISCCWTQSSYARRSWGNTRGISSGAGRRKPSFFSKLSTATFIPDSTASNSSLATTWPSLIDEEDSIENREDKRLENEATAGSRPMDRSVVRRVLTSAKNSSLTTALADQLRSSVPESVKDFWQRNLDNTTGSFDWMGAVSSSHAVASCRGGAIENEATCGGDFPNTLDSLARTFVLFVGRIVAVQCVVTFFKSKELSMIHELSDRLLSQETSTALKTIRTILENMEDHGIVDIFAKYTSQDIAASFYALYRLQRASKQYQTLYQDDDLHPSDLVLILEDLSHYVVYASAAYGWKMDLAFKGKLHLGDEQALIRKTKIGAEDIIKLRSKSKAHLPVFFLVRDRQRKALVLCVRGTWSAHDVLTDLCCTAEEYDSPSTPKQQRRNCAHHGMLEAAMAVAIEMEEIVEAELEANPDYSLILVGHSMGGGVASILATIWETKFRKMKTYLFGGPCVAPIDSHPTNNTAIINVVLEGDPFRCLSIGHIADTSAAIARLCEDPVLRRAILTVADENIEEMDKEDLKFCWDTMEQLKNEVMTNNNKMFPAGRIFHIRKSRKWSATLSESDSDIENDENQGSLSKDADGILIHEVNAAYFQELVIGPRMFDISRHLPSLYEKTFHDLLESEQER